MKPIFPIYEFLITDEDENDMSGVNTFSLVSKPAMKTDFIKFSEIPMQKYIFIEKDKKQYKGIVAGIAMKPNELIPRITDSGEKFLGYFSPETIEKIRTKFHRNPENQKAVNLEHNHNNFVNAFLIESYILDSQEMVNAVKAKGIKDATIGSWYTAFKIEDKEVFERCLKGEFNGFSVEAFLNAELTKNNFSTLNIKKMKKNIIQNVKEKLNAILEEMSFKEALVPELNIKVSWGSVGDEVTKTYQDTEGNEKTEPVGQGEFVIEDGRTLIVDENSTLVEIREKPAEEKPVEEMAKEEMPEEEKKEEEMPEEEKPVEEMPEEEKKEEEEEKKEEEEEKKEEEEEEMPVSGDTKEEKEEVELACEDCPDYDKETMTCKKKKIEEEDMMVEEEFAPMGNDNACQHGRRSTDASGYCNGMASPEKATGTYKQGKKVKKQEDKPAEEKPKAEAPKAEEKKEAQKIEKEIKEDIKKEAPVEKKDNTPLREGEPESPKPKKLLTSKETSELRGKLKELDKVKDKAEYDAIAKKLIENDLNYAENQAEFEDYMIKRLKWWDNYDGNPNKGKPELIAGSGDSMIKTIESKKKRYEDEAKKLKDILNSGDYSNYGFIIEEFSIQKFNEMYGFELLQEDFSALKAENESLKAEVAALKVKLSEPIAEPKLKDEEPKPVDFSKLSNYEKAALRKGLPIL